MAEGGTKEAAMGGRILPELRGCGAPLATGWWKVEEVGAFVPDLEVGHSRGRPEGRRHR